MAKYTLGEILELAMRHEQAGHLGQAEMLFRQVLLHAPADAAVLGRLGTLVYRMDRPAEAADLLAQAAAGRPDSAELWSNLGAALAACRRGEEALAACQAAIRLRGDLPEAHGNLGNALKELGRIEDAIAAYHRGMELAPQDASLHSNLLLCLHYHSQDPAELYAQHRRWDQLHARPVGVLPPSAGVRDAQRRLRVGYVSPDLCDHAVARFLLPLLTHHDPERFELFAYAQVMRPDEVTQLIMPLVHQWRPTTGLSDDAVAAMVRRDEIDVLVDLAGHTRDNRLLVFARRPAPVQVTYLGYPNTTGLAAIGYRLTDAIADPPGASDEVCSERLIRLPRTAWCYQSPRTPPLQRQPRPGVVFGNTSHFAKMSDQSLQLWARVLHRVAGSRLRLKSAALSGDAARQQVLRQLGRQGISADRVMLDTREPSQSRHLEWYNQVDIILDTVPYHGTTTTCEALWMGVPVVTLAQQSHCSRVGASLLGNVGLGDLVASCESQYIERAAALAADRLRLAELHATLRGRMHASPLTDGEAFAREVEAAYRQLWRQWCVGDEPIGRSALPAEPYR